MTLLQNKFLKYYIGYNDFFDEIDKVSSIQNKSNLAFDIIKYDYHNYEIHVALAGIEPNQIKINTNPEKTEPLYTYKLKNNNNIYSIFFKNFLKAEENIIKQIDK